MYPLGVYLFVDRAILLSEGDEAAIWVRRALAAVAIDASCFGKRDAVNAIRQIKRWSRASGIDYRPLFEEAIDMSTDDIAHRLRNALDEDG
jgi:hypothetical protein